MSSEQEVPTPSGEKTDRRRGPRVSEEEMRARIEAEMRASIEAEVRAKVAQEGIDHRAAKARAEATAERQRFATEVDLDADGAVTVHFVEDGMTLLGKVWLRGEELTVKPETEEWAMCSEGDLMILTLDEDAQLLRYERRMWKPGPWRGLEFDLSDPNLTPEDREKLLTIQRKRQERAPYSPNRVVRQP